MCYSLTHSRSHTHQSAAELGELGAVQTVVAGMKLVDDYELQSVGIRTLANLAAVGMDTTKLE